MKDSEASADCFAPNKDALNETGSSDPEVEQVMKLPGTVTELTSKEGVKVYIVGTVVYITRPLLEGSVLSGSCSLPLSRSRPLQSGSALKRAKCSCSRYHPI